MQNYFISGLVAIFFWGKNSSKTVKKILEASWPRTFVYAFLCIVVFAFLYKTYEIATVYNMVQIVGVKHSSDSSGHVLDTAKISIVHKLSESSMQQGDINKMEIREISRDKEIDDVLNKYGGVYIDIMANAHPYEYKSRNILGMDQNAKQELKMQLDKNNIPYQKVNHFYQVGYLANDIPSIIPFYPLVSQEQDFKMKGDYMFYRKKKENSRNSSIIELIDDRTRGKEVPVKVENRNKGVKHSDILNNGICFVAQVGTVNLEDTDAKYVDLYQYAYSKYTNSLDFFTSADISQYTYVISLNSDCPVKDLYVDYDIPIEMANNNKHISVGTRGFYLDSVMVNNLRKVPSMGFQVKFPSLANLQLIRSLILTTLLTALFSLFCKNLYYSIRKWAYGRRKKNWIPIGVARTISVKTKNEVRHGQRVFKRLLYTLIVCFMISIAVITLIVCINTSILLPEFEYEHLYFIPIIYVFISALLIYYGYKKVRYPLLKAQYGNDESDMQETEKQPFTIFIHERDEAAEYDRLVQEQLNESQEKKIVQSSEEDANE